MDHLGSARVRKNFKRTHRVCRSGCRKHKGTLKATISHNIGNNTPKFKYGLLNTRSIRNKTEIIHELLIDKDFDSLAITETWLSLSDIDVKYCEKFYT